MPRKRKRPVRLRAAALWCRGGLLVCALLVVALPCRTLAVGEPSGANVASGAYRLIVHPSTVVTSIERSFAAEAFLKKVRRWPDGATIRPVDLAQNSPTRRRWSSDVLRRSVEAVRSYWQQMIFSGRELPPPEMESDDDVIGYVLRSPGSIGYVSVDANLRGVKVVTFR